MTDLEKKLTEMLRRRTDLLQAALFALNSIPNRGLNHPDFSNTYKLASAIEKELKL